MSELNNETKLKLIQLYRKNKCLWKTSDSGFSCNSIRNRALDNMAEELNISRDVLQNEIRILRKSYLIQKLRIKFSRKYESQWNKNKPIWWLFNEMRFIDDDNDSSKNTSIPKFDKNKRINEDINTESGPINETTRWLNFDEKSSSTNKSIDKHGAASIKSYKPTFKKFSSTSAPLKLEEKYELGNSKPTNDCKQYLVNDKIRQSNQSRSRNSYFNMSFYLTRAKSASISNLTQLDQYNFQSPLPHHTNTKLCTVASGSYPKTNIGKNTIPKSTVTPLSPPKPRSGLESTDEYGVANTKVNLIDNATLLPTFKKRSSTSSPPQPEDKYEIVTQRKSNVYKPRMINRNIRQSNQSHSGNSYINMSRYLARGKSTSISNLTQYNRYNSQSELNQGYTNTKPRTVTRGNDIKTNIVKNTVKIAISPFSSRGPWEFFDDFNHSSSSTNESIDEYGGANTQVDSIDSTTLLPTFEKFSLKSAQPQLEDQYEIGNLRKSNYCKQHMVNDKIRQSNHSNSWNPSYINMSSNLDRVKSTSISDLTQFNRYNLKLELNKCYTNTKPCTSGSYTKTNIPPITKNTKPNMSCNLDRGKSTSISDLTQYNRYNLKLELNKCYTNTKPFTSESYTKTNIPPITKNTKPIITVKPLRSTEPCTVPSGSYTKTSIPKIKKNPISKNISKPPSPPPEPSNNSNTKSSASDF